jgi:hypothetical protein
LKGEKSSSASAFKKSKQYVAQEIRRQHPHATPEELHETMAGIERKSSESHGTIEGRRQRILHGDLSDVREKFLERVRAYRAANNKPAER